LVIILFISLLLWFIFWGGGGCGGLSAARGLGTCRRGLPLRRLLRGALTLALLLFFLALDPLVLFADLFLRFGNVLVDRVVAWRNRNAGQLHHLLEPLQMSDCWANLMGRGAAHGLHLPPQPVDSASN
jgi:hypothetical protein